MTYPVYSDHAPTGESATRIVSTNPYSAAGKTIGYPTNLDLYVQHLSDAEGSQAVVEARSPSELVGSRLYLHHRPMVAIDGTPTTITVSNGVIDSSFTNASQAYVVFSTLPTVDFTISYVAVPDCELTEMINNLQDSVMEIQGVLGPNNDTSYPGIKNLKIGIFDNPTGYTAYNVLNNGISLPHLDQDVRISSSDDPTLKLLNGSGHNIQIGLELDNVIIDATGLTVRQSNGAYSTAISLGAKTGDTITWKGSASGAGPLSLGGPEWGGYSGVVFSGPLTPDFYTGSMLRVHGDVSIMGGLNAIGDVTIVNTTGTTSTVFGDWTVRDELFVEGISHLIGPTETNELYVAKNIHLDEDLIADNQNGSGGNGQTLIDGLDCSEVAWTYSTSIKARHPYSIVSAPMYKGAVSPKNISYRPWMTIAGGNLVGDVFAVTGTLNAAASFSGAHPNILQLLTNMDYVTGTYGTSGTVHGVWSPGMMQPGSMWLEMLNGQAAGFKTPIYGYTLEEAVGNTVTRLNVFSPEAAAVAPQANDMYLLYNPNTVLYNSVSAAGGATPTFSINASVQEPLAISFSDTVRVMQSSSATYSLTQALTDSVSGLGGSPVTGIAYIFADANGTDIENPPIFKARAVPIRMDNQTPIGEVVASYNGATWTILDTISYRPNGIYDSAWIPILQNISSQAVSGRVTPGFSSSSTSPMRVYFHHNLGTDLNIGNISANLYLGYIQTGAISWNQTHTPMYSVFGQDNRNPHGLAGSLIHVPLGAKRTTTATTDRDASIFYLDSSLIGVDISPALVTGFPYAGTTKGANPTYLRLVLNKNN